MDAGSTGSRIHVYRFNLCGDSPVLEDEIFEQLKPGLSSFKPDDAANSLKPLMDTALKNVPAKLYKNTPLTLKATAGLRLLPDGEGQKILDKVSSYLHSFPFFMSQNAVEIMDGKDEGTFARAQFIKKGIYAWITVNHLLDNLSGYPLKKTAAIMDLGGGSTQIVFEPLEEISPGTHRVSVPYLNRNYTLYQKSYDGYGLIQGRKKSTAAGGCAEKTQSTCISMISSLFNKKTECELSPCSFDGVYMPMLEDVFYEGDIYAFSYFYDIFAEPYGRTQGTFKVGHIHEAVKDKCTKEPDSDSCLDLGFIYSLLRVGYDLPKSRDLKTAKKIKGFETGWCLGAALAMLNHDR